MQLAVPASNNPLLIEIDLSPREKAEADWQGVSQVKMFLKKQNPKHTLLESGHRAYS